MAKNYETNFIDYDSFNAQPAERQLSKEARERINRFQARHFGKTALEAAFKY